MIKTKKRTDTPQIKDPEQFRGIVVSLAWRCHSMLPQSLKNTYDVTDLVQDGMFFLYKVLNRVGGRKAEFNPARSQASTWVYSLMFNFYTGWHDKEVKAKKRKVELVEFDDNPAVQNRHAASSRYADYIDAFSRVESLHRACSIELVSFLDDNLFQHPDRVAKARGTRFHNLAQEFRRLTSAHKVTIDDYRIVMSACAKRQPQEA